MLQASELKDEINAVVEAIDNSFRIEGDLEEADVEQLHGRLVVCVDMVNHRLRRCDSLLRKGLKAEAIQEAEIAPSLLGLVDELDAMSAWDGWADYVRQFGIPPQPPLLIEIAAALNLAYSLSQPIEKLLRRHRLLAIARAPLKDRVVALRELAARDTDSTTWKSDLIEYETTRLRQIEAEFRTATKLKDLKSLSGLMNELEVSPWSVRPSTKLREAVREVRQRLRVAEATEKLHAIAKELNSAFSDFDLNRGRLTRSEWDRYNEIAQIDETSELHHEVAAVFQWLDEEDEAELRKANYQRAIAELEQGLDQDSIRRPELTRLFAVVERFDEAIPDRLTRRLSERLSVLAVSERRRGILVLAASIMSVLTCGGLVALVAFFQVRAHRIQSFEAALSALITDEKLDEAETMLATLGPSDLHVSQSAYVQKLRAELDGLLAAEASRRLRFSEYLQNVLEICTQSPSWEQAAIAEKQLKEAAGIARHEHEMVELKRVEKELRNVSNELQSTLDDEFQKVVAKLFDDAKSINSISREQIQDLLRRTRALAGPSRVSNSIKAASQLDSLIFKLEDSEKNLEFRTQASMAKQRLLDSVGQLQPFRNALAENEALLQIGYRASDFRDVLGEELSQLEEVLVNWNNKSQQWNRLSFDEPVSLAEKGLPLLTEFQTTYADLPFMKAVSGLSTYLESVKLRGPMGSVQTDALLKYLSGALFRVQCVTMEKDGRRFYIYAPPSEPFNDGTRSVRPSPSPTSLAPLDKSIVRGKLTTFASGQVVEDAPHTKLARLLETELRSSTSSYEYKICASIMRIYIAKDVDPIARGEFLLKFVDEPLSGSSLLKTELQKFKLDLAVMKNFQGVNWFAEGDDTVNRNRQLAETELAKIFPTPKEIFLQQVDPGLKKLRAEKTTLPLIHWIGVLLRDDDTESPMWYCHVPKRYASSIDSALHIRYPDNGKWLTLRVGELKSGVPTIDPELAEHFKEGRPVWIGKPESP